MRCEACGHRTRILESGLCLACADEQLLVARERDAMLIDVASSWATCDYCGAEIDGAGLCPRCQRETNEWLEDVRRRAS